MTNDELHRLSQPRLSHWLFAVGFDWIIIVIAFICIHLSLREGYWGYPVIPIAMIVIGTRQHALGIMGHDGAHRLACRNKRLNDLLTGILCFWPMGFSIGGYRAFHFSHHRKVGTPDDPEIIHTRHQVLGQWRLPLRIPRLLRQMVFDLFGGSLPHLRMAARLTNAVDYRDRIGPMMIMSLTVGLCWYLDCWWILAVWFGSIVTVFWIIFRLRMWTEHTVEDVNSDPTHRISASWWQRFLFLPHNTYCHWEHHKYPQVPCWNLIRVREIESGPEILTIRQLLRRLRGRA